MGCNCNNPQKRYKNVCGANTPPVLEVHSEECPVLFHTVIIPASVGNITTIPPTPGAYRNARVTYEADDLSYLYDSDGIPQLLSGGGEGGKVSSVNGKIGEVVLNSTDVGAASKTEFDNFVNTVNNELDRAVLYDLEMESNANSVTFKEDKINVVTGVTTQETDIIPSASETTAGTISASEYQSIKNSQDRLDALEGGSVAVTGLSSSPTQQDLTDAWLLETGYDELINRASIYDVDNTKVWTYYDNTTSWYGTSAGGVTIGAFTNSTAGTILGSTIDGNVSANLDGTGSVSGWASLVSDVSGKADASSLATVATSGLYSDLTGTPSLATVATTGLYSDLTDTPSLATVATSGAYSDLTGTPTIPVVDSTLSTSSTNAIENQAVANALDGKQDTLSASDITNTLINNGAVTGAANSDTTVADSDSKIALSSVGTPNLRNGAVTLAKIDATTLFTSQSGQGLGPFVLSDAIENYDKLEIEYYDNSGNRGLKSFRVVPGGSNQTTLTTLQPGTGLDNTFYIQSAIVAFYGTNGNIVECRGGAIFNGTVPTVDASSNNNVKISSVVGYK